MDINMTILFTGAGGLDWGFHNNGDYKLVIANEILEPHLKTYADNHHLNMIDIKKYSDELKIAVCGDVHDLIVKHDSNLVLGGPPCQDFSVLREAIIGQDLQLKEVNYINSI